MTRADKRSATRYRMGSDVDKGRHMIEYLVVERNMVTFQRHNAELSVSFTARVRDGC